MAKKLVVLDPGHGQNVNDYFGITTGKYYEGNQMFKLAYYLAPKLEANGISVIVTRKVVTDNPDLTVRGRTAGINKADMFISLHSDAIGSYLSDRAKGVSCYYSIQDKERNKKFATMLTDALSKLMNTSNRGALTRIGNGGTDYYGVIRSSAASGCKCAFLCEHGFHTNPHDAGLLIQDSWLEKIAETECRVICEFLGVEYKPSDGSEYTPVEVSAPTTSSSAPTSDTYEVYVELKGYVSSSDAMSGTNAKTTIKPGTYYIYRTASGAYNITKSAGTPGSWINPNKNTKPTSAQETANPSTTIKEQPIPEGVLKPMSMLNKVYRVDLKKFGNTSIKIAKSFKYGDFATEDGIVDIKVSKDIAVLLQNLKDELKITKVDILNGFADKTSNCPCNANTSHKNGLAVDIICYDKNGIAVPGKYVATAAEAYGFNGVVLAADEYTVHVDARGVPGSYIGYMKDGKFVNVDVRKAFNISNSTAYNAIVNAEIPTIAEDYTIRGHDIIDVDKLIRFVKSKNIHFDENIAKAFITIGRIYGIRGDVALAQSCVETGYFKYEGSAVTPDQHNYCGLGVTSKGVKGCEFETVEQGVEAQLQHLYAYSTSNQLPTGRIQYDPRFTYVTPGIAPKWTDLNMRWAITDIYGQTILNVYRKMLEQK